MDRSTVLLERVQKLKAQREEIEALVAELQSFTLEPASAPAAPAITRRHLVSAMAISFVMGAIALAVVGC